ncbi:protein crumbs homolog 3-like [Carcharodon carcharias]|uniref:protein crumbs homolog 3-like n=1 Tax=Carcharodon carcharias TaxID=13397 RepID=UPI001B7E2C5E|nr:protein crumbs homolog 3-like [Carcharodon carcharias]XP_041032867.1 protein crumbs homolog 3-like [Carcharodon carcharias]XP_041032868.1 protein crumbs homolog 3-like [Carcharodon carcharias]
MERLQYLPAVSLLAGARSSTQVDNTTSPNSTEAPGSDVPIAAIVAPCVIGGVLLIVIILAVVFIKLKGKRRDEGTYNPSQQEQIGARTQVSHGLKLPPEERLI